MLHLDRFLRLAGLLVASLVLPTIVTAQTILPSAASASFPQCALSCTQLIQAQNACIPPAQAVTDQFVYATCFCTSPLTAQLRISPDGTCDAFCTVESDRTLLQSWFNGFCASQTATVANTLATSSTSTSALSTITTGVSTVIVIISATSSSSTGTSPTTTGAGTTVGSSSSSNKSWIDNHWRWILMLGLLIIGLGLLAFFAVCLKRRHRRKIDEKRASLSGFPARPPSRRNRTPTPSLGPELWGPHQHMAHTRGWEYNHEEDTSAEAIGAGKKNKKIRRNQSEKGGSRGASQSRAGTKELDSSAPGVLSEKIQRRRAQEQERERERNRDQYAENRSQSMKGAVSAYERDKDRDQRSQTMREKDKVAWSDRDPEKIDVIEKI